jgi:hypothetical protein
LERVIYISLRNQIISHFFSNNTNLCWIYVSPKPPKYFILFIFSWQPKNAAAKFARINPARFLEKVEWSQTGATIGNMDSLLGGSLKRNFSEPSYDAMRQNLSPDLPTSRPPLPCSRPSRVPKWPRSPARGASASKPLPLE